MKNTDSSVEWSGSARGNRSKARSLQSIDPSEQRHGAGHCISIAHSCTAGTECPKNINSPQYSELRVINVLLSSMTNHRSWDGGKVDVEVVLRPKNWVCDSEHQPQPNVKHHAIQSQVELYHIHNGSDCHPISMCAVWQFQNYPNLPDATLWNCCCSKSWWLILALFIEFERNILDGLYIEYSQYFQVFESF